MPNPRPAPLSETAPQPGCVRPVPSAVRLIRLTRGWLLQEASRLLVAAGLLAGLLTGLPVWAQSAEPPSRVVTLAPHITEMVFAAGAGDRLVGTVLSSNYPAAARTLPKVGDGAASINAETLARLAPDLVLAWHDSGAVRAVSPLLQGLDIELELLAPARLDDIPDQVEYLGKRLGTEVQAAQAASTLRKTLLEVRRHYAHRPPVTVFIEAGHAPLYAVGRDILLNDALQTCGAVNVFKDHSLTALPVGVEQVLAKRPNVILAAAATPGEVRQARERWASQGVDESTGTRVYGVDPDTLFRPGPRLIEATDKLCALLEQARKAPGH